MTSKLNNGFHRPDDARRAFDGTLAALGLDYVDLFLIHWPLPTLYDGDFVSTWQALEEFKRDGRARSIGVSNFQVAHLQRLAAETDACPRSTRSRCTRTSRTRRCARTAPSTASPPRRGRRSRRASVLGDPTIVEIAERVGRTPAQVVLRWHIQRGDIVFPKSITPERIGENFALFDFELEPTTTRRSTRSTRARTGGPGRTPTPSTTSRAERAALETSRQRPAVAHAATCPWARRTGRPSASQVAIRCAYSAADHLERAVAEEHAQRRLGGVDELQDRRAGGLGVAAAGRRAARIAARRSRTPS